MLVILFSGCGDDKTQNSQISELQNKVLDLEDKLKSVEGQLEKLETRYVELSKVSSAKTSPVPVKPSAGSPSKPNVAKTQTLPATREEMRAHSQRRMQLKRERMVIDRAKRTILALMGQSSLDEIVSRMNSGKILHPDGASWTRSRLEAFIKENRIENRPRK